MSLDVLCFLTFTLYTTLSCSTFPNSSYLICSYIFSFLFLFLLVSWSTYENNNVILPIFSYMAYFSLTKLNSKVPSIFPKTIWLHFLWQDVLWVYTTPLSIYLLTSIYTASITQFFLSHSSISFQYLEFPLTWSWTTGLMNLEHYPWLLPGHHNFSLEGKYLLPQNWIYAMLTLDWDCTYQHWLKTIIKF